ncbi:hypothetical protein CISG_04506 [Coccidioides immitis RMSCC 3703]|uniref:Uncharacterized protein n=1 Tax=Coccidioides immitis RMSCC 3703 TaxID=454286 RepID=A0A0J8QQJ0_COCIT|nr:hypothetical protein CISG_04506 [Coccidioides immitis RMSCC 3703]
MQLHPLVAIFDRRALRPAKLRVPSSLYHRVAAVAGLAMPGSLSSPTVPRNASLIQLPLYCTHIDPWSEQAAHSLGSYMRSEFSAARLINLHSLCVTAPLLGARVADDKTSAGQIIRYTVVSVGIPGRKTLTRLAKECQRVRLTAILVLPGTEANPPVRG